MSTQTRADLEEAIRAVLDGVAFAFATFMPVAALVDAFHHRWALTLVDVVMAFFWARIVTNRRRFEHEHIAKPGGDR